MKLNLQTLNYKKIAITSGVLLAYGIIFGFFVMPMIIKVMINFQVSLRSGNEARDIWSKTPFPLHFLIYVFNITNPEEFVNGGKAKVQEIGPYYFEEWKDKFDMEENDEEDSITYSMRNTWIFKPELSNGLTGEEIVSMPHPLVELIAILIQRTRKPMLTLVSKGLKILFPNDFNALYTGKVMDIFFRGIPIDCDRDDFGAKAICTAFYGGDVKNALQYNKTRFLFSYFAHLNHSSSGRFTACRGIKNIHKLGKVIRIEGEPEFDAWHGEKCNELHGTDSTIYPPYLKREDRLWTVAPDVCRSFGPVYRDKSKYAGLQTSRFTLDFGDLKNEPENYCFCGKNPPDDCPVKGTMNLAPCLDNAPLIASMPHFLHGDESLFENIEGLSPNEEKHLTIIDLYSNTGTPFKAAKRVQINMDQEPVELVQPVAKLRKMVVPLFWIEEGVALNKTYVNMVKPLVIGKIFNQVTRWLSIIIGFIGFGLAGYIRKQKNSGSLKISNVKTATAISNDRKNTVTPVLGEKTTINNDVSTYFGSVQNNTTVDEESNQFEKKNIERY